MLPGEAHLEIGTRNVRLLQPDDRTDGCIEERPADCDGRDPRRDCLQRVQEVRRFHDADQDNTVDDGAAAGYYDIVGRSWNRHWRQDCSATRDHRTRQEVDQLKTTSY